MELLLSIGSNREGGREKENKNERGLGQGYLSCVVKSVMQCILYTKYSIYTETITTSHIEHTCSFLNTFSHFL